MILLSYFDINVGFTKLMQTLLYIVLCTYTKRTQCTRHHSIMLVRLSGPRAHSQFLFCLKYHTSLAALFKNYCNFSSSFPANIFLCYTIFFFLDWKTLTFGKVSTIIWSWWSCPLCDVTILLFLALPGPDNADNNDAKPLLPAKLYFETYCHCPIKSSSNKMPSSPGAFAYRTALYSA